MNLTLKERAPHERIAGRTAPTLQPVPQTPALELRAVRKSYGSGRARTEALDGLNLRITPGEFVAIIGHSGCGKSTVLSMVAGLTDLTEGAVLLDAREELIGFLEDCGRQH